MAFSKISRAQSYLKVLNTFNTKHIPRGRPKDPVDGIIKICVIDTGLDESDRVVKGNVSRILTRRSWVEGDTHDSCGHGTHISRLILGNTNSTCLMVAKVTEDKSFKRSSIAHIVQVCACLNNGSQSDLSRQLSGLSIQNKVPTSYRCHWDFMNIFPILKEQSRRQ
jgi:hypothetical protein